MTVLSAMNEPAAAAMLELAIAALLPAAMESSPA